MSARNTTWLALAVLACLTGAASAEETPAPAAPGSAPAPTAPAAPAAPAAGAAAAPAAPAAKEAPAGAEIVVTPKLWGVPEMQVRVSADDYRHFLDGSLSEKEFAPRFSVTYHHGGGPAAGANRSFGRLDITAGLGFRASFTTEDPHDGFHP